MIMSRLYNKKEPQPIYNARTAALAVLNAVDAEGAFSNLKLRAVLDAAALNLLDRNLATALTYGTIQRRNTLDWLLRPFVQKGWTTWDSWVRNLLRMSVYQLFYMDKIPPRAAVFEAVEIAKRWGNPGAAKLVNAVLRNWLRHPERRQFPSDMPAVQRLSLTHSFPEWMVERFIRQLGQQQAEQVLQSLNQPPQQTMRVNLLRNSREQLLEQMSQRHAGSFTPSPHTETAIRYQGEIALAKTREFEAGQFTLQDESSQLVTEVVNPRAGMRVLDACAAPGGKATHLAEKMGDRGWVEAWDISPHKVQLIEAAVKRLGIGCVHPRVQDAFRHHLQEPQFDAVLLDAPCSGLGVIRRRPDLKWNRQPQDIPALADLQRRLLASVAPLVKPGGVLVYSTCTISREENQDNLAWFLQQFPQFVPDSSSHPWLQGGAVEILPTRMDSDGFFICRFRRQSL